MPGYPIDLSIQIDPRRLLPYNLECSNFRTFVALRMWSNRDPGGCSSDGIHGSGDVLPQRAYVDNSGGSLD